MAKKSGPKQRCFVIAPTGIAGMPMEEHGKRVLRIIQEALAVDDEYEAFRPEQINDPGSISEQIAQCLVDSPLTIADLTGADPFVYYNLALGHSLGKPIILLIAKGGEVPPFLRDFRHLEIDVSKELDARDSIQGAVRSIKNKRGGFTLVTPISNTQREKAFADFLKDTSQSINAQIEELGRLARQIEDTTRKPLHGIDEVFAQIYLMLQNARIGGPIWFVGMTLGLGPPHRHRAADGGEAAAGPDRVDPEKGFPPAFEKLATLIQRNWADVTSLNQMFRGVHEKLALILERAERCCIVCLRQDSQSIKGRFLDRLAERPSYATLKQDINKISKDIIGIHNTILKKMGDEKQGKSVKYVDSIPLQILIVEKADVSPLTLGRKTCLVFHVGTGNISTHVLEDGETGFYTEVDSIVEMFETMTESLFEGAPARRGHPRGP